MFHYSACYLRKVSSVLTVHHRTASMAHFTPTFTASKDSSLADEPILLTVSNLDPKQRYSLHASVCLPNSSILESLAHYVSDDNGCIDLEQQESYGGDYVGIEAMGPLSFMRPSSLNRRKHERFLIKDPTNPFKVDFRLFHDFIPSLEDESAKGRFETKPSFTITRTYMAPGVREIPVWDGNVRATLYLPPGKGPFPGVISMSGGYPGAMKYKAALLASHGFAALALKYFGEDDLPENFFSLEIEYIEESLGFLKNHPLVAGEQGVGIIANCYGGTLALAAASILPKGLIRCVVSINGWSFPYGEITYKGKKIGLLRPTLNSYLSKDGIRTWDFQIPEEATTFEVFKASSVPFFDHHNISYLFVLGEKDGYTPSSQLSVVSKELLEDAKHPDFEVLFYKGAGHLIEHSFYPLANIAWTFQEPHFNGGEQPGHSKAQNGSWPRILEFVWKRLYSSVSKL